MEAVTRQQAIQVILELFERYFGSEKGSRERYFEVMEAFGLAMWDEDCLVCIKQPPDEFEFLLALGVQPDEFYNAHPGLNVNFFDGLCELYHVNPPDKEEILKGRKLRPTGSA